MGYIRINLISYSKTGAVPKQKCQFYDREFCKHKNNGCDYFHPEDSCADPKCENRNYPKRHQVPCKFRDKCKFRKTKKCEFIHKISPNIEHKEDITKKFENMVKTLEDRVTFKEKQLDDVTNGMKKAYVHNKALRTATVGKRK